MQEVTVQAFENVSVVFAGDISCPKQGTYIRMCSVYDYTSEGCLNLELAHVRIILFSVS